MTMEITIKQKLTGFAIIVLLLLLGVGTSGYWGVRQLHQAMQIAVRDAAALRNHMESDMMHHALRADVYMALHAGPKATAAEKQVIRAAMAEHIKIFKDDLRKNDALPLDAATKTALAQVRGPLDIYIRNADLIVDLALTDSYTAETQLEEFVSAFDILQVQMVKLRNRFVSASEQGLLSSRSTSTQVTAIILTFGAIAAVVSLLLAWLIPSQIGSSLRRIGAVAAVAASGDLTVRSTQSGNDEVGQLGSAINTMLTDFQRSVAHISGAAAQLATASEEMSSITEQATRGAKRQQGDVDQVATAMHEMSTTVLEVARNAERAAHSARDADEVAKTAAQAAVEATAGINTLVGEIDKASTAINQLDVDSQHIGKVLEVIRGIADQTNLLALNAAIEAARAGEQGRGFAVVADEVRTLASRTQQSTQEIQGMIERLQSGAKNAVKVMEQARAQGKMGTEQVARTSASLTSIAGAVVVMRDMNAQIASAAEEQSAVAEEINRNLIDIRQVAAETAQGSEQTASASQDVARLAIDLEASTAHFKIS